MRLGRLVLVGASALLLAACGGGAGQGTSGQTVGVTLDEFHLKLDAATIPAGAVTFQVNNLGKEKHEFVILRTDLAPNALPLNGDQVAEEGTGVEHVDEIAGLVSGETQTLTVTLKPGTYVVVCNFPGHVHGGMIAPLKVT
jgi:uncharacterized cupredoxin-like copper-binding protein